jgi:hypothetical protein
MKVIREVVCSKCGKKQIQDGEELLREDLFWRTCKFCDRYGLVLVARRKLTMQEWMEALFYTIGFRVTEAEAFLKRLLRNHPPL